MAKEEKVEIEEKGQKFQCGGCGCDWSSKVKRAGIRYCETCVELRRSLNGFLKRGMDVADLKSRIEKVLE